jgi:hypothetical protein
MTKTLAVRYELWEESGGDLGFFPESNLSARALLTAGARLIWSCEAVTWEDAQAKKREYLGWGDESSGR